MILKLVSLISIKRDVHQYRYRCPYCRNQPILPDSAYVRTFENGAIPCQCETCLGMFSMSEQFGCRMLTKAQGLEFQNEPDYKEMISLHEEQCLERRWWG